MDVSSTVRHIDPIEVIEWVFLVSAKDAVGPWLSRVVASRTYEASERIEARSSTVEKEPDLAASRGTVPRTLR